MTLQDPKSDQHRKLLENSQRRFREDLMWWFGVLVAIFLIFVFKFNWLVMILTVVVGILLDTAMMLYRNWKLSRDNTDDNYL